MTIITKKLAGNELHREIYRDDLPTKRLRVLQNQFTGMKFKVYDRSKTILLEERSFTTAEEAEEFVEEVLAKLS